MLWRWHLIVGHVIYQMLGKYKNFGGSLVKNLVLKSGTALLLMLSVSACSPVSLALGAGAAVGSAALQEGGIKGAATDAAIKLQITDAWVQHDFEMFRNLALTVKEGRVLVTGSVTNPDMRVEAVRLAWKVDGVKQVLNEVMVEEETNGLATMVSDSVITGSLKTRIMFDKEVNSLNYTIDTNKGNIYLMGVARTQEELDKVIEYARTTRNVNNVVNYVRLRQESLDNIQE